MTDASEKQIRQVATSLMDAVAASFHQLGRSDSVLKAACGSVDSRWSTTIHKKGPVRCLQRRVEVDIGASRGRAAVWTLDVHWRDHRWVVSCGAHITHSDVRLSLGGQSGTSVGGLATALEISIAGLVAMTGTGGQFCLALGRLQADSRVREAHRTTPPDPPLLTRPTSTTGAEVDVDISVDMLANGQAAAALESFALACDRLDDFARDLAASAADHVITKTHSPYHDGGWRLEKMVELDIQADIGQLAYWNLLLGWRDGRWIVGSFHEITHSDFYIESDDRYTDSTAELERLLAETVGELVATARPGSELSRAIEELWANAQQEREQGSTLRTRTDGEGVEPD